MSDEAAVSARGGVMKNGRLCPILPGFAPLLATATEFGAFLSCGARKASHLRDDHGTGDLL